MSQVIPYLNDISSRGFKVALLSFEKKKNLLNSEKMDSVKRVLLKSGIDWHYLPYHKKPAIPATVLDILNGLFTGAKISATGKITIIHARGYIAAIIAYILKKIYKIKLVFDIRGLWPEEKVDAGAWDKRDITYKAMKFIERRLFSTADWIIVLSNHGKELLNNLFGITRNISIVPTCVDLSVFSPAAKPVKEEAPQEKKFTFLYLGSLGSWYLLDEMLDFFKVGREYFKNARFLFLNNNNFNLQPVLKKEGFSPQDYFIKSVERQEINQWINMANVSVFFIKPCFSKIFSCPTKFAESLSCGLPVVINYGIGDTQEIVEKENIGVVLDGFSDVAYRRAITRLNVLLSEGQELSKRCRMAAEKYFSLEDGVRKYMQIYANLSGL